MYNPKSSYKERTKIMTNLPNTNKGDKYEPINGIYSHEIAEHLPFWLGSALKYVWRAPRKGKEKDLRKAATALTRLLDNASVYGIQEIAPYSPEYWGEIRHLRQFLKEYADDSVHAKLVVSILNIILEEGAGWGEKKHASSVRTGLQYAKTVSESIHLLESTSKKKLMGTATAWETMPHCPPF